MRLLDKYKTIEEVGIHERHRYSRKAEKYCYQRECKCSEATTAGRPTSLYLFWINMSYIYGLMQEKNPQRFL